MLEELFGTGGVLEAIWGWPPPVLDPAGPYAERVVVLAWVLIAIGVIVTGIVILALWVAVRGPEKWRQRLGGEKAVWIMGIAFPGLVLTGLLVWGLTLTASLSAPITGNEQRIRVVGEMWWFRVQYLGTDGEVILEDANELHLPVGRPVVLELTSADVIHNFWVPRLSGKKDMIPGRATFLRVLAGEEGRYGGVCAEYCGGPHALMGFVAVTHEPAQYARWLQARVASGGRAAAPPALQQAAITLPAQAGPAQAGSQGGPQTGPAQAGAAQAGQARGGLAQSGAGFQPLPAGDLPGDPVAGRALFMASGCGACHRVAGTEANGLVGPDLTHVGGRLTLGAGILPNHRGTLIGWIGDSQSIKPGNRMPSYDRLSAQQLHSIAAWLEQQR